MQEGCSNFARQMLHNRRDREQEASVACDTVDQKGYEPKRSYLVDLPEMAQTNASVPVRPTPFWKPYFAPTAALQHREQSAAPPVVPNGERNLGRKLTLHASQGNSLARLRIVAHL